MYVPAGGANGCLGSEKRQSKNVSPMVTVATMSSVHCCAAVIQEVRTRRGPPDHRVLKVSVQTNIRAIGDEDAAR